MGSTHSAPKTIAELAREALPCLEGFCGVVKFKANNGHDWDCPYKLRPAVESAIREAVRQEKERCALECERLFLDEFGKTHEPIACAGAIRVLGEPE